jgi:hypothetical protein
MQTERRGGSRRTVLDAVEVRLRAGGEDIHSPVTGDVSFNQGCPAEARDCSCVVWITRWISLPCVYRRVVENYELPGRARLPVLKGHAWAKSGHDSTSISRAPR